MRMNCLLITSFTISISISDVSILSVAVASGVVALVLCVISCICCYKHSRGSQEDNSDSRRDTVPLEDLLSKPSLADPESVFSEASYGGRLSVHTNSWTGLLPDGTSASFEPVSDSGPVSSSQDSSHINHSLTVAKAETHASITAINKGKSQSQKVVKNSKLLRAQERDAYLNQRHSTSTQSELTPMLEPAGNELKRTEAIADSLPKKCAAADSKIQSSPDSGRKLKITQDKADKIGIDPTGLKIHRDSIAPEKLSFLSSTRCSFSHEVGHIAHGNKVPRTSLPRTEESDDSGSKGSTPNTPEQRRAATVADITCQVSTSQTLTHCSSTVTINSTSTMGGISPTENIDASGLGQAHTTEKPTKTLIEQVPSTKDSDSQGDTSFIGNPASKDDFGLCSNASIQANITHSSEVAENAEHRRVPMRRYSSSPQGSESKQDIPGTSGRKTFSLNLQIDFHFDHGKEPGESVPVFTCSPIPYFSKFKDSSSAAAYVKDAKLNTQVQNNNVQNEREAPSKEKLLEQSFAMKSANVKSESLHIDPKRLSEPTILECSDGEITEAGQLNRRYSVAESPPIRPRKRQSGCVSSRGFKHARQSLDVVDDPSNITISCENKSCNNSPCELSSDRSETAHEQGVRPTAVKTEADDANCPKQQSGKGRPEPNTKLPKESTNILSSSTTVGTVSSEKGDNHENIMPSKNDELITSVVEHSEETGTTLCEESAKNEQYTADEVMSVQNEATTDKIDAINSDEKKNESDSLEKNNENPPEEKDIKLHGDEKGSVEQGFGQAKSTEKVMNENISKQIPVKKCNTDIKKTAVLGSNMPNLSSQPVKNPNTQLEKANAQIDEKQNTRAVKETKAVTDDAVEITKTEKNEGKPALTNIDQRVNKSTPQLTIYDPKTPRISQTPKKESSLAVKTKSPQLSKADPSKKIESQTAKSESSQPLDLDSPQPLTQDSFQPSAHDSSQPVSYDSSQPLSQESSQPMSHDSSKPMSYDSSQPLSHDSSQPLSHDSSKPVSHDSSRPMSQNPSQPLSQGPCRSMAQGSSQALAHDSIQPLEQDASQPLAQDSFHVLKTDSVKSLETVSPGPKKTNKVHPLRTKSPQLFTTKSPLNAPKTDSSETAKTELRLTTPRGIDSGHQQGNDKHSVLPSTKGCARVGRSQTTGAIDGRLMNDNRTKRSAMIFAKTPDLKNPHPVKSNEMTPGDKERNPQEVEAAQPIPKPRPAPRQLKSCSATQKNVKSEETLKASLKEQSIHSKKCIVSGTNQDAHEKPQAETDAPAITMSKEAMRQGNKSNIPVFYVDDDPSADDEIDDSDVDDVKKAGGTKLAETNNNCELDRNSRPNKSGASITSTKLNQQAAASKIPDIVVSTNSDDDDYDEIDDTNKTEVADDAAEVSDESDYDNPWDNLDDAVKRASIRYNRRPSRIAAGDKAILLKSAEDLGRLMEEAEKRRQLRQAAARSSCQVISPDESMTIPFTRFSPLRHTVKGIMSEPQMTSSQSTDNILQTEVAMPPKLSLLRSEEAGDSCRAIDARRPQSLSAKVKTKTLSPESKKRKK